MLSARALGVVFAVAVVTQAASINHWSQPCFNHTCTYHIPGNGHAQGTLRLWGPPGRISDITAAAGWEILDCDKDKLEQEIRIVCVGETGCDHLHAHGGPEGKIVRLPESCGKMAFALIKRSWVHEDQSVPRHISRRLHKRKLNPVVLGKRITHIIAGELTKEVKFEAIGTTSQVQDSAYVVSGGKKSSAVVYSWDDMLLSRREISGKWTHRARDFLDTVTSAFNSVALRSIGFFARHLFGLNEKNLEKAIPIKIEFPETIMAYLNAECGQSSVKTQLSGYANGDLVAMVGVHMRGTLDGEMEYAEAYIQMKGLLKGGINLDANLNGRFGPIEARVFQHPLDILDFGRIFTVGPKFDIIGIFEADFNMKAKMKYDFEYNMDNLRLSFPPDNAPSDFRSNMAESPLKAQIDQSMLASGKFVTHMIPRLTIDMGLSSSLHATMFVAADIGVASSFSLDAHMKQSIGVKPVKSNLGVDEHAENIIILTEPDGSLEPAPEAGAEVELDPPLEIHEPPPPETKVDGEDPRPDSFTVIELTKPDELLAEAYEDTPEIELDPSDDVAIRETVAKRSLKNARRTTGSEQSLIASRVHESKKPKSLKVGATQSGLVSRFETFTSRILGESRRSVADYAPTSTKTVPQPKIPGARVFKVRSDRSDVGEAGVVPVATAPAEKQSLLNVVPGLETTFGNFSDEMVGSACVFAQPSLRIIAGIEADASIINLGKLLGFRGTENAYATRFIELYTTLFEPLNVAAGDATCPVVGFPAILEGYSSTKSLQGREASIIRSREVPPICAVSSDSLTTKIIDTVEYLLSNEQKEVLANPQIAAGNSTAA